MLTRQVVLLGKQSRFYSSSVAAKKFLYAKRFQGEPKISDFELVEENLPALKDGEILTQAEYLSVDPYMRAYMIAYPVGVQMIGGQVAKIIESKNPRFPAGSSMFGEFGWRTLTISNPDKPNHVHLKPYLLPNFGNLPKSLGLGYLGMPGNSAYFGFLDICKPQRGETVVVTGAAGAVGSLVGQIAKIKGCKVVGFAGSDDKCQWLEKELGFDKAINYKTAGNLKEALKQAAPNGVDCYFDNVGGEISSMIYSTMNKFGRISVCGAISGYNSDMKDTVRVPPPAATFVVRQLRMEGFLITRPEWTDQWFDGLRQIQSWIESGQIKYNETITEGFENLPQALIDMLRGKNVGKAVVKA